MSAHSQPDDPLPEGTPDGADGTEPTSTFPVGPFDPGQTIRLAFRLEVARDERPVVVEHCQVTLAEVQGPDDLVIFQADVPAGSIPIATRFADRMVAMQFDQPPSGTEVKRVPVTFVRSPIKPLKAEPKPFPGELDYPCFRAQAPRHGRLVEVNSTDMTVTFMTGGHAPCEREPPRDPRFIAVPSGAPVPERYRHLGLVQVGGQWFGLYCPDLHIPPPVQIDDPEPASTAPPPPAPEEGPPAPEPGSDVT